MQLADQFRALGAGMSLSVRPLCAMPSALTYNRVGHFLAILLCCSTPRAGPCQIIRRENGEPAALAAGAVSLSTDSRPTDIKSQTLSRSPCRCLLTCVFQIK